MNDIGTDASRDLDRGRRLSSRGRRLSAIIQCNIVVFSIVFSLGGICVLTCAVAFVCKCRKDCKKSSEMHTSLSREAAGRHTPNIAVDKPEVELEDKGVKVTVPIVWDWTKPWAKPKAKGATESAKLPPTTVVVRDGQEVLASQI